MDPAAADGRDAGVTPLGRMLREMIAAEGPMPVSRFMALALGHPVHGYYINRDPFGREGDFTTAPEISQMFGELLGLWAATVWDEMGRPSPFRLVELGPGRGTLMADALRAARALPGFREAADLRLVETSPVLRGAQRRTLEPAGLPVVWHERMEDVPAGPTILLANEFLDALPIRQFARGETGWHERLVGLGPDGGLVWGLAPEPDPRMRRTGRIGEIAEASPAVETLVATVAALLVEGGGAALFIDYGHLRTGAGATLQAVSRHAFADPLASPGEADLTAHVDFEAVARAAREAGARVHGPITQGAFLRTLGIAARAERLARGAAPAGEAAIRAAERRLTGPSPDGMGDLFKVVALSDPALTALPGLPAPAPAEDLIPC
jgi:SAM-dependent MidA family methyltransferase